MQLEEQCVNILLVEDNDVDALLFKRALRNSETNTAVVRARDGIEALDILHGRDAEQQIQDPYVILLDINMPRMDGHTFLTQLRESSRISNSRVIVVTTSADPKDIELAYDKCASGYVVKPSGSVEMTRIIQTLYRFWKTCEHPRRRDELITN